MMDFYELLDHVLELLRQRERVTYRALKRQFHLDDEVLDDLKEEILYGQRLAVEEDGRVLVWTGGAGAAPPPISSPPSFGEAAQVDQWTRVAPPSSAAHTPEAERRQLTVLFCDLVDSTVLASQLDPEEWREVVRAYQETCAKVIARFEGHIAQYLGDGLLVYFGYPQAHEDDAQRAVRAGLGMVEAMGQLNARMSQEHGVQLDMRLGIHTGQVVVGEIGGGARHEQLALGETPNIAARIQGLAAPDTVVVSATSFRLIQGYFACHDLGAKRCAVWQHLCTSLLSCQHAEHRVASKPRSVTAYRPRRLSRRGRQTKFLLTRWYGPHRVAPTSFRSRYTPSHPLSTPTGDMRMPQALTEPSSMLHALGGVLAPPVRHQAHLLTRLESCLMGKDSPVFDACSPPKGIPECVVQTVDLTIRRR